MLKYEIIHGDCLDNLTKCDMIFADPPDNIGLRYEGFKDSQPDNDYAAWFESCLLTFCEFAPVVWVSFNSRWTLDFAEAFSYSASVHEYDFKPFVQTFTFYRQNRNAIGNAHRPLWRLQHRDALEYPQAVKIPSWRELNCDKRAKKGGKVPGDSLDHYVEIDDSFFDYSRVVGNSKQRRKWCPTQLNEDLVERCIKLNTLPGQHVLDPFCGTGTTLRVCKKIGRQCTTIEKSETTYKKVVEEHGRFGSK